MIKKNILHVIDNLAVGGAETLLVNTVNSLSENYNNIIVYLNEPSQLKEKINNAKIICLGHTGVLSILPSIIKLRKIIVMHQIDIVHAHLLWSSVISRLACPPNLRLVFSVHSILSEDAFIPYPKSLYLEKFTYKAWQEAIFVSEAVKEDYDVHVGLKGKTYVLHNFISDDFFKKANHDGKSYSKPLRLVSVGTLKEAKNYAFLISEMSKVNPDEVTLDIFGNGPLQEQLQSLIGSYGMKNVTLKGMGENISQLLTKYDVFVSASKHEGFGLAPIEGMASGLPCLLSDIPAFREVANGNALFFDLSKENDFFVKISELLKSPILLQELATKGEKHAKGFNKENYLIQLMNIYG
ncbi:glycosyltransferase [Rufibacter soli]